MWGISGAAELSMGLMQLLVVIVFFFMHLLYGMLLSSSEEWEDQSAAGPKNSERNQTNAVCPVTFMEGGHKCRFKRHV